MNRGAMRHCVILREMKGNFVGPIIARGGTEKQVFEVGHIVDATQDAFEK
jgi:hypothetical protein